MEHLEVGDRPSVDIDPQLAGAGVREQRDVDAVPIVGPNAYCFRMRAPARKTGTGMPGTLLATKSTLRRIEPMYQRGIRFSAPAISCVYGNDRSFRIWLARRWISPILCA